MTTQAQPRLERLESLAGHWVGTSQLWCPMPTAPIESECESTADVALTANGRFLTIEYTWALDGKNHQGFMLVGREPKGNAVTAAWVDSWHMSDKPMISTGTADESGRVNVLGSYGAPPDPLWGWRTEIKPRGDTGFEIVMWNITPEGEEAIAFQNVYESRRR